MNISSSRPTVKANLNPKKAIQAKTADSSEAPDSAASVAGDLVYKSSRALAGAVGGTAGVIAGFPFGSVKGAVSETNQLSPKAVKMIRTAGAVAALGAGIALALNGHGSMLGLNTVEAVAAATLAGPLAGVVATNAAIGLGEGLVSGVAGGVKGAVTFGKKGGTIGMDAVDWIVQK